MQTWLIPLAILAIAAAAVAGGAALLPWLKSKRQGYPLEAEIEQALLPYLLQGIIAAYQASEWAIDGLGRRLRGADKAQLAAVAYSLLPERIGRFELSLVKTIVTAERFAQLVQNTFDWLDTQIGLGRARYRAAFSVWLVATGAEHDHMVD